MKMLFLKFLTTLFFLQEFGLSKTYSLTKTIIFTHLIKMFFFEINYSIGLSTSSLTTF